MMIIIYLKGMCHLQFYLPILFLKFAGIPFYKQFSLSFKTLNKVELSIIISFVGKGRNAKRIQQILVYYHVVKKVCQVDLCF